LFGCAGLGFSGPRLAALLAEGGGGLVFLYHEISRVALRRLWLNVAGTLTQPPS
jgi:hypothetical protein